MALAPIDVVLTAPVNNGGSPIVSYRVDGVPATAGRANITVTGLGKALSLTQVKFGQGGEQRWVHTMHGGWSWDHSCPAAAALPSGPALSPQTGSVPVCGGQPCFWRAVHILGICHQWGGHGASLRSLQVSRAARVRHSCCVLLCSQTVSSVLAVLPLSLLLLLHACMAPCPIWVPEFSAIQTANLAPAAHLRPVQMSGLPWHFQHRSSGQRCSRSGSDASCQRFWISHNFICNCGNPSCGRQRGGWRDAGPACVGHQQGRLGWVGEGKRRRWCEEQSSRPGKPATLPHLRHRAVACYSQLGHCACSAFLPPSPSGMRFPGLRPAAPVHLPGWAAQAVHLLRLHGQLNKRHLHGRQQRAL